jgi:LysM domain
MDNEDPRGRARPSAAVVTAAALAGLALGYGIYSTWRGDDGGKTGVAAHRPTAGPQAPAALAEHDPNDKSTIQASQATGGPRPAFDVVRIAKDGRAVLAGRGPAKARITILDGDTPIAEAVADENGEWVALPDRPLAGGTRQLTLSALLPSGAWLTSEAPLLVLLPGADGAAGTRLAGAAPTVVRLAGAPRQPSLVLRSAGADAAGSPDALALGAIDYDELGNVVASGTAPPATTIRVYLDNRPIGDVTTKDGSWRIVSSDQIPSGNYTLRIDQLGADSHVSARIEVPFARASASEIAAIGPGDRVVIQPGNNLWRIARRAYGRGVLYTVIYRANADQIRDPDLIYPGQIFALPRTEG